MSTDDIEEVVKEKYGETALRVGKGGSPCCGSAPPTASACCDPITFNFTMRQKQARFLKKLHSGRGDYEL